MLTLFSTIIAGGAVAFGGPTEFHPPVRLKADGVPVHVEEPGWACPCWADMDGDGKKDLLVGQFNGGKKFSVYKNLGDGKASPRASGSKPTVALRRNSGRLVMHQLYSTVCGHRRRRPARHPLRLLLPHDR